MKPDATINNSITVTNLRQLAKRRREFIIEQVKASKNHEVTDAEIVAAGKEKKLPWGVNLQSLKDDAEFFERNDYPVYRPPRGNKFVYNPETKAHSPYEFRKNENTDAKKAIGQLAADLIRGADREDYGVKYTRHDIFERLKQGVAKSGREIHETILKLKRVYEKHERLCALDSGTSTLQVANVFKEHWGETDSMSDPASLMRSLTFLTNSNDIAKTLSHLKSQIQVIMLGGRLRKETQAFAGSLAKSCLNAWNIHLDTCMVGTIGVKRANQEHDGIHDYLSFMSDTYEEVEVKQALFARSQLRVVLVDSSKLKRDKKFTVGHFSFADVRVNDLDIIITENADGIEAELNNCWKNGVAVLVADKN